MSRAFASVGIRTIRMEAVGKAPAMKILVQPSFDRSLVIAGLTWVRRARSVARAYVEKIRQSWELVSGQQMIELTVLHSAAGGGWSFLSFEA